jgi:hypothetical protein
MEVARTNHFRRQVHRDRQQVNLKSMETQVDAGNLFPIYCYWGVQILLCQHLGFSVACSKQDVCPVLCRLKDFVVIQVVCASSEMLIAVRRIVVCQKLILCGSEQDTALTLWLSPSAFTIDEVVF